MGDRKQNKPGDYYDMVSDDTGADVAYAATFNDSHDVYYLRLFPDCNTNGVLDETDLAEGTNSDFNSNGLPDECGLPPW